MNVMKEAHKYARMNRISYPSYREALRCGLRQAHQWNKEILANQEKAGEFVKENEHFRGMVMEMSHNIHLNAFTYGTRNMLVMEKIDELDDDFNAKTLWTGLNKDEAIAFFNANFKKGRK